MACPAVQDGTKETHLNSEALRALKQDLRDWGVGGGRKETEKEADIIRHHERDMVLDSSGKPAHELPEKSHSSTLSAKPTPAPTLQPALYMNF